MTRPHAAFPARVAPGGSFVAVEQGSPDHVAQRCLLVLSVAQGSLIDEPTFGIPDEAFTSAGTDLETIRQAVDQWVPSSAAIVTDRDLVAFARTIGVTVNAQGGNLG